MEPTLFRFIFRFSLKQQLLVLLLTAMSFPFFYYSLDLPKTIINQAIQGRGFPKTEFGFEFSQVQAHGNGSLGSTIQRSKRSTLRALNVAQSGHAR